MDAVDDDSVIESSSVNITDDLWTLEYIPEVDLLQWDNSSFTVEFNKTLSFPLYYRIAATLCHTLILILGVSGNSMLIYVARKATTLQTPTYRYLVSLAYADLLVIVTVVPEAILYHVYECWLMGPVGCAIFIYLNFVSINVGSLSILAFTVERFVAICYPLLARKVCTMERTTNIIRGTWIFTLLYCSPWLGLTTVREDPVHPDREQCSLRLHSREAYIAVFGTDLLLFYVVPLVVAIVVYVRIGRVLCQSLTLMKRDLAGSRLVCAKKELMRVRSLTAARQATATVDMLEQDLIRRESPTGSTRRRLIYTSRSRVRVLRMLIVIVILFAIAWLPYRGLLVYNTFVEEPWLHLGYMFFAKTLIYLNSAMNPFLYNAMSSRFRLAMRNALRFTPVTSHSRRLPFQPMFRAPIKNNVFLGTLLNRTASVKKATAHESETSPVNVGCSPKDLHEELVDLYRCHYVRYCPPCRDVNGTEDSV